MKVFRVLAIVLTGLFVLSSCDLLFPPETQSIQECLNSLSSELNKSTREIESLKALLHTSSPNYNTYSNINNWNTSFPETDYAFSVSSQTTNSDGTVSATISHGSSDNFFEPLIFVMKETDEDFWLIYSMEENGSTLFQVK